MTRIRKERVDTDPGDAARREYESDLTNAWKYSEFQQVLHFAVITGLMTPLATFLASKKPLARGDRLALAGFVRSLEKRKRGRPQGRLAGDVNVAKRNAVYLVRLGQQSWCSEHGRQRVPPSVTDVLIANAIKEVSSAFKVSAAKISADEIYRVVSKNSRKIKD